MSTVQERLQLTRTAVDKWSTREQLCLASAVSCSGDQNWMSVSRSLKLLCGTNRPADWFSQKSCAVQFGELLENVETPKRKKRAASEKDTAPTAETPTESILKNLTYKRIDELKKTIQKDRDQLISLKKEILSIQNGTITEEELREMAASIEKEKLQQEEERKLHVQWLKEREERKLELQRAWKPVLQQQNISTAAAGSNIFPKPESLDLKDVKPKTEEQDDESVPKPVSSPLLTSLLKASSPVPTTIATSGASGNVSTSVRAAVVAPTITNLLTGNLPSTSAVVDAPSNISLQHIQNQPLTVLSPVKTEPQTVKSPSQSAPTLSMLLESKKSSNTPEMEVLEIKQEKQEVSDGIPDVGKIEVPDSADSSSIKDEDQQLMEVFKGLIPDNIDEFAEILENNNAINFNEEELLEEESILENVESLMEVRDEVSQQIEPPQNENVPECSVKNEELPIKADEPQEVEKMEVDESVSVDEAEIVEEEKLLESTPLKVEEEQPVEIINDDQTPAEQDVVQIEETETIDDAKEADTEDVIPVSEVILVEEATAKSIEETEEIVEIDATDDDQKIDETEDIEEEKIELVVTTTSHEPSTSITLCEQENVVVKMEVVKMEVVESVDLTEDNGDSNLEAKDGSESSEKIIFQTTTQPITRPAIIEETATITLIDTDDDSPIEVIKDEKVGKAKRDYSRKKPEPPVEKKVEDVPEEPRLNIRSRLRDRDGSESPLIDDESSEAIYRTRRRYSSTPILDSIPNSPASSDDREYKAWKKSILVAYNRLITHKYASAFLRPITEDVAPNYKSVVYRPMDLQTIKRNIENGSIRTTAEFQRDVMMMGQNAIMFNKKDKSIYNMARELMTDSASIIENVLEATRRDLERHHLNLSTSKIRSRKSNRLP